MTTINNTPLKEFYFSFSQTAAERFGYHIVTLKDGNTIKYTSICESKDYFDRAYSFTDKVFISKQLASDIVSFTHVSNEHNINLETAKTDPYSIVQQIKQIRNNTTETNTTETNIKETNIHHQVKKSFKN